MGGGRGGREDGEAKATMIRVQTLSLSLSLSHPIDKYTQAPVCQPQSGPEFSLGEATAEETKVP